MGKEYKGASHRIGKLKANKPDQEWKNANENQLPLQSIILVKSKKPNNTYASEDIGKR